MDGNQDGHVGSNQYTKAKQTGVPYILSDATRKKLSDNVKNRSAEWHKENGKKISATIQKKVENGTWHVSLAKHLHITYNNVDLHGKWELAYAQYLDTNQIPWVRNKVFFNYVFEGKTRRYTPDFYLPLTDEYIEIKGYKTKKDESKWSQFPKTKKLIVLMKNELKQLNII